MSRQVRSLGRLAVIALILVAGMTVGGPVGQAAAAADAVTIDSATEYGDGTIEIVFNRSVDAVDWVDVYVDGDDKGRISSPGSGGRIEVESPIGDITPNRNLTVVTQLDRGGNANQIRRAKDVAVATTTINASNSDHRSLANAAAVFQGEPVAFVSDGNTDVEIVINERNGDTVLDQRTGTNSSVIVFESDLLTIGSSYRVQFGSPDVDEWYNISDLRLSASILDDQQYLAQFAQVLVTSVDRGDVTVEMTDRFGNVIDTDVVTLGRDRQAVAILAASEAGQYSIDATHNGSANVVSGGSITFEVTPAALGSPSLSATLGSDGVDPGAEITLPISIMNNGSVTVGNLRNPALTRRVTNARGLTVRVDPRDQAPLTVHHGSFAIGSLVEGRTARIDVPVSIDDGTRPGVYRVPINVTYRYTNRIGPDGEETLETVRRDLNVSLVVDRAASIVIENVSGVPQTGSSETVSVTVANVGTAPANATRVRLSSPNPDLSFAGAETATRFLDTLRSGENRTLGVDVAADATADVGSYPLELAATYENTDGQTVTSPTRFVNVGARDGPTFQLDNLSSTLTVGEEGTVRGRVTYSGGDPVTNAIAVFEDDRRGMTVLERSSFLGRLESNDTAAFAFPIQLSKRAEPGEKQFSITVQYRNRNDERRESDSLDGRTTVDPEGEAVSVEAVTATVPRGGNGFLNLTVRNTGAGPYTDLRARLFADGPLSAQTDERQVERLSAGSATTLSFPLSAAGGAMEKEYPIELLIRYDDPDGT
ncbi:MAG: COG1361 S-layer family protein, partial [Salinirussus sp.]